MIYFTFLFFLGVALKAKRAKSNCQILPAILAVPALPTPTPSSFVAVTPQQVVIDLTSDSNEEEIRIPGQQVILPFSLVSAETLKWPPQHRMPQTLQQATSPTHKVYCYRLIS